MNSLEPAWLLLARKAWRRVQLDDVASRLKATPPAATQADFIAALHEAKRAARAVKQMDRGETWEL